MAPECFDKKRNEQTDIWAVGVILYEILAENRPFEDDNLINLVSSIATKEPESLLDYVPTWLKDVVSKSLAKNPAERYKTANEMRSHLRQLAKIQEPIVLPNPTDDEKTLPYDNLSVSTLQSVKKENSFWKIGTVALSAILLSVIGGAIYLNQPSGQTAQNTNQNSQIEIAQNTNKVKNIENTNLPTTNTNIVAPSSNPTLTSTPEEIKQTDVSVRFVNEARACNIIKGTVTLKTQGKTFTARTGNKGFASFNDIPCGETATITVFDSETSYDSDEPAIAKIPCKKSAYLGAFNIYYGNKISEERANFCYKLNPN